MSDITARVDDAGFVQIRITELVEVSGKTTRDLQGELKAACKAGAVDEIARACAPPAGIWQATDTELAERHGFGRRRGEGSGTA